MDYYVIYKPDEMGIYEFVETIDKYEVNTSVHLNNAIPYVTKYMALEMAKWLTKRYGTDYKVMHIRGEEVTDDTTSE